MADSTCENIAFTPLCEPVVDWVLDSLDFDSAVVNLELVHQCASGGKGQEIASDRHRHLRQFSKGLAVEVTKLTLSGCGRKMFVWCSMLTYKRPEQNDQNVTSRNKGTMITIVNGEHKDNI